MSKFEKKLPAVIDQQERVAKEQMPKTALSLRPGPSVVEAAAEGKAWAKAIADGWRFKFPVRLVSAAEHARMVENGSVVFNG